MEVKHVTMNAIPILSDLIVVVLSDVASKARKTLGDNFSLDLIKRASFKNVLPPILIGGNKCYGNWWPTIVQSLSHRQLHTPDKQSVEVVE